MMIGRKFILKSKIIMVAAASILPMVTSNALAENQLQTNNLPSSYDILAKSNDTDWENINPDNIVIFSLENGYEFSVYLNDFLPKIHVKNIKNLVKSGWFDKAAIVRVQENYVIQWGREEGTALPPGIIKNPPAEYEFNASDYNIKPLKYRDTYASKVGFVKNWAIAGGGDEIWLPHCYSMVGVGRDMAPDVGTGQELYVVNGQAPRHLDRNITVVGRIIDGMDKINSLSRGSGEMGFYETPTENIKFKSVILASQLPADKQKSYKILKTDTKTFDQYINAKANRGGPFFIKPLNAVDICNAMPPIRIANPK